MKPGQALILPLVFLTPALLPALADSPTPDEKTIGRLIEQLGDDDFDRRLDANERLKALGRAAVPQLRRAALNHPNPEVQYRADKLSQSFLAQLFSLEKTLGPLNLTGNRRWIARVATTGDGKQAVTAGDECLATWDLATGKVIRQFAPYDDGYWSVALSPDGKRVIAGGNRGHLGIWEAESGKEVCRLKGHSGDVWGAAFTADGKQAVTGAWDGTLRVWDVATGKEVRKFGSGEKVRSLALSPDGRRVIAGEFQDSQRGTVRVYDLESGTVLLTLAGHTQEVSAVAVSPDGAVIASASFDRTLRTWNAATGKLLRTFRGHASRLEGVTFAESGKRVVTCGDREDPTLRVWDAATGNELHRSDSVPGGLLAVAALPGGKRVVTVATDACLRIWRWTE